MPTLKQDVDELRSNVQAGVSIDDSRLDDLYLEQKLNTTRAAVIAKYINSGSMINSAWTQKLDLDPTERDEECRIVTFECPTVIHGDGRGDGFTYVGHTNGLKPFIRLSKERVSLAMHSAIKNSTEIYWEFLRELQDRTIVRIHNNFKLEFLTIKAVFNDPREVRGYRKDTDMYPMDATLHNEVMARCSQELIQELLRAGVDRVSDGSDKPQ